MTWLSKIFDKKDNKRNIEMLHIFNEQLSGRGNQSDHFKWIVATIHKRFTPQAIEELKEELLSFEQRANSSAHRCLYCVLQ